MLRKLVTAVTLLGTCCIVCSTEVFSLESSSANCKLIEHDQANVKVEFYQVTGVSVSELRTEMDQKGPGQGLAKYDAYTKWRIDWNWPRPISGKPIFSKTKVNYQITVVLPNWTSRENASKPLIEKWDNFLDKLCYHELGHIEHVTKNYQKIHQAISKRALENKELSTTEANQIATNILKDIRRLDGLYDQSTKHGRTQGVKFP